MSSTNFVATLGEHSRTFLGRATSAVYKGPVVEAELHLRFDFVLVSAPPEPEAYPADEKLFGCITQGKKTLAKAPVF
ncbi:MAG: hypothetical protein SH868_20270 [Bythopirellula sp.]|nr:hypothetical protein [Bythopirellula sp.]